MCKLQAKYHIYDLCMLPRGPERAPVMGSALLQKIALRCLPDCAERKNKVLHVKFIGEQCVLQSVYPCCLCFLSRSLVTLLKHRQPSGCSLSQEENGEGEKKTSLTHSGRGTRLGVSSIILCFKMLKNSRSTSSYRATEWRDMSFVDLLFFEKS